LDGGITSLKENGPMEDRKGGRCFSTSRRKNEGRPHAGRGWGVTAWTHRE